MSTAPQPWRRRDTSYRTPLPRTIAARRSPTPTASWPEGWDPGHLPRPPRRKPGQLDPRIIDAPSQASPRHRLRHRGVGASTGTVPTRSRRWPTTLSPSSRRSTSTRSTSFLVLPRRHDPQPSWSSTPSSSASSSSLAPFGRGRTSTRSPDHLLRHLALHAEPKRPKGVPVLQTHRHRQACREGVRRTPQYRTAIATSRRLKAFQTQLKRSSGGPAHPPTSRDHPPTSSPTRQRSMVPSVLSEISIAGQGLRADHLPRLRPRWHLPVPQRSSPVALEFPRP